MKKLKRLPDSELEIMQAMWGEMPPVTAVMLMEVLNKGEKTWKLQTVHTLLGRLEERGFLKSEKKGKERYFTPLVEREEYLSFETKNFVDKYYRGKKLNLISALYQGEELTESERKELKEWLDKKRREK